MGVVEEMDTSIENKAYLANAKLAMVSQLLEGKDRISGNEGLMQAYDQAFDMLIQHFAKMLRENAIPGSNDLLQRLKQILANAELFRDYPELLGDTVIGAMGCPSRVLKQIDEEIIGDWAEKGKTIPVIWTHADTNLMVVENIYDHKFSLKEEELQKIFDLAADEMDISQLLQLLCVYCPQISANKTVIDIPCNGSLALRKALIPKLDVLYVYYKNYTISKLREMLQELKDYRVDVHVILPMKERKTIDKIKSELKQMGVTVLAERDVQESVTAYEGSRNNFSLVDVMRAALAPYEGRYVARQAGLKEKLEALKKDAVQIKDGKTEKTIQALFQQIKEDRQCYDKRATSFLRASENLLLSTAELEKAFAALANETAGRNDTLEVRKYMGSIWANLTISYLRMHQQSKEIKYYKRAETYLKKVEDAGLAENDWLPLVWNGTFGRDIPDWQKKKLQECDFRRHPDIASALLYLHHLKKISLPSKKLLTVAASIKEPQGKVENFYKGYCCEQMLKPSQAVDYYMKAWKEGEDKALGKLVALKELVNKRGDYLSLEKRDAYHRGKKALETAQSTARQNEGMFYLKVAAADNHVKAIEYLSEYYYAKHIQKNRKKDAAWENENALLARMFEIIKKRDLGYKKADFYIGMLAYARKDYQKAKIHLKERTEPKALAILAKMYYHGWGTSVNKQHAEMFARKADQQGESEGTQILRAIQEEKKKAAEEQRKQREAQAAAEARRRSRDDDDDDDDDDDGCCAIVSATCDALQIEHRTYHRTVCFVRHLRNKAVEMTVENQDLAAAYYIYATNIVKKINAQPTATKIYEHFWKDYITPCVAAVRKRDYENAWKLYVKMSYQGCVNYHVELPPFIHQAAKEVIGKR